MKHSVVYQDEHILIANKPAGILTIPDRSGGGENLHHALEAEHGQLWVVHRLDRETSGVLCFARNEHAHRHLNTQFSDRKVEKHYLALLEGLLPTQEGVINRPIGPHPAIAGKMMVSNKGKEARTLYTTLENFRHYTLVDADIKTGRTHQIRVHFHAMGYPLAIDAVYGRRAQMGIEDIKRKGLKSPTETPLMSRTSLHAHWLLIEHPVTGEKMRFEAPLHKDFSALLNQLRKWGK